MNWFRVTWADEELPGKAVAWRNPDGNWTLVTSSKLTKQERRQAARDALHGQVKWPTREVVVLLPVVLGAWKHHPWVKLLSAGAAGMAATAAVTALVAGDPGASSYQPKPPPQASEPHRGVEHPPVGHHTGERVSSRQNPSQSRTGPVQGTSVVKCVDRERSKVSGQESGTGPPRNPVPEPSQPPPGGSTKPAPPGHGLRACLRADIARACARVAESQQLAAHGVHERTLRGREPVNHIHELEPATVRHFRHPLLRERSAQDAESIGR